jgi:integrase
MTDRRINEVKSITKKRGQLTIEFFDNEGKIRQKDTGLSPTKTNRANLRRLIPEFEKGLREKQETNSAKTFSEYAHIFLQLNKNHSKLPLMTQYVKRFCVYFGEDTYPKDIKLSAIKQFFANLHKKDGTPLKRPTKVQWRQVLKGIMQLAFEDGELQSNHVADWKLPKQDDPPNNIRPFTPDEVKTLLTHSKGSLHNYIGIGVWSGLRPEELVGLMIKDIDFNAKVIHVRRSFSKHKKNENTKTSKSRRKVPIFDAAVPFLQQQIAYAKSRKSLYLFCKADGSRPISSDDVVGHAEYINNDGKLEHNNGPWQKLRIKVGLPTAKAHWTRHTFAVQALKSKQFTPQEVAGMMGILLKTLFSHYAKYIGDDHLHIDRKIDLYSA